MATYSSFLSRFEKGKSKWGAQTAINRLEYSLRFRAFAENLNLKESDGKFMKFRPKQMDAGYKSPKKFYCNDFNKGYCLYPGSHEGRFNKMLVVKTHMCKACWENDGLEKHHPENHGECPHRLSY